MKTAFIILLLLSLNVTGQVTAPDFTLTDINGNVRNLYSQTDSGKTVVLDFFSTLCGTCITNTPVLENIWQTYGYSGDSLYVWGIESTGVSDSLIGVFEDTYFSSFPLFSTLNDDIVIYIYNITFTPQYFVVCPDRSMKPYDINDIVNGITSCNSISSADIKTNTERMVYSCNDEIIIKNLSVDHRELKIVLYDMLYNKINYLIENVSDNEMHLKTNVRGVVIYEIFEQYGKLFEKGRLIVL